MPIDGGGWEWYSGMLKKGLLEGLEGLSFLVRVKAFVSTYLTDFDFMLFVCVIM